MAITQSIGAFTAATQTSTPVWMRGPFNFDVAGTFVGTVVIERSFDSGTTWSVVSRDTAGNQCAYTAPASFSLMELESSVQYRTRCSAYTSGTINTRLSQ